MRGRASERGRVLVLIESVRVKRSGSKQFVDVREQGSSPEVGQDSSRETALSVTDFMGLSRNSQLPVTRVHRI